MTDDTDFLNASIRERLNKLFHLAGALQAAYTIANELELYNLVQSLAVKQRDVLDVITDILVHTRTIITESIETTNAKRKLEL